VLCRLGVIRIETETDIERLRQVALLQRAELDRLYQRLGELTSALARARGEDTITALQLELTAIQEQLAARTRELFGPSSEKHPRTRPRARATGHATPNAPRAPAMARARSSRCPGSTSSTRSTSPIGCVPSAAAGSAR
jgi:hypothetical protein